MKAVIVCLLVLIAALPAAAQTASEEDLAGIKQAALCTPVTTA